MSFEEYTKLVEEKLIELGVDKKEIPHMISAYQSDIKEAYLANDLPVVVAMPIAQNF